MIYHIPISIRFVLNVQHNHQLITLFESPKTEFEFEIQTWNLKILKDIRSNSQRFFYVIQLTFGFIFVE